MGFSIGGCGKEGANEILPMILFRVGRKWVGDTSEGGKRGLAVAKAVGLFANGANGGGFRRMRTCEKGGGGGNCLLGGGGVNWQRKEGG